MDKKPSTPSLDEVFEETRTSLEKDLLEAKKKYGGSKKEYLSDEDFEALFKHASQDQISTVAMCPHCQTGPAGFCECDDSLDTHKNFLRMTGQLKEEKKDPISAEKRRLLRPDAPDLSSRFGKRKRKKELEKDSEIKVEKPNITFSPEVEQAPKPTTKEKIEQLEKNLIEKTKPMDKPERRTRPSLKDLKNKLSDGEPAIATKPEVSASPQERPKPQYHKVEEGQDPVATFAATRIGTDRWPSQVEINKWKNRFDKVYYIMFDEDEPFFFRRILNYEDTEIRKALRDIEDGEDRNAAYNEMLFKRCVLFPVAGDPLFFKEVPAGCVPTIVECVMSASNYIGIETALKLIRKI